MESKLLWQKLSGSINYYIKDIWKERLLESDEDLLKEYLEYAIGDEKPYTYFDKKEYKEIELEDEVVERTKKAFLERIAKKKVKYSDEIEEIRLINLKK